MNGEHFRAFVWLRWRLRVNQFRKAGPVNLVLFFVFLAAALMIALVLLAAGFVVGLVVLPDRPPAVHLFVWVGVIVALLFCWMIGLVTDLQRSEALALDKVLHLPVSPSGAFLINYLSSLFSLTLIVFLPGMVGLVLGQACAGSLRVLLLLPLVAAFVLAVTAVTYQFQGWLASLMTNPRRRRTVIVVVTGGFVLVAQVPNLIGLTQVRSDKFGNEALTRWTQQREAARADLDARKISAEEYAQREQAYLKEYEDQNAEDLRRTKVQAERIARFGSTAFPPGWLALGAYELAGGSVGPALLGTLGLGLIGAVSLRGSYRTTLRIYTGALTGQGRRSAAAVALAPPTDPDRVRFLERRLPWVSEQASAVALAAFRSLLRAPEAKMAMLAPVVMPVVFAGAFLSSGAAAPPAALRPLVAFGGGMMALLMCGGQLIGNQFGYDRNGFRAYVLSPVPRREILLGKNLAVAPLGLGMGVLLALLVGTVYPMRIDHYPAVVAQLASAFMAFCMLANALSIIAPIPLAAGSIQPARVSLIPALLQMALVGALPVALVPVLLPIGIEFLLAEWGDVRGWPVSLALSLLVLTATTFAYRAVLTQEGRWMAIRERTVLEVVTSVSE